MQLKNIALLFLTFFVLMTGQSCKEKGCTNPNAINYNSVADEDDGTCILCNGTTDTLSVSICNLFDYNVSSPHYGDNVGVFHITQVRTDYPYAECGTKTCHILVRFESKVNSSMEMTFNLQCSGFISFSWGKTIMVTPLQNLELGSVPDVNINNPCSPISQSSLFCNTFGSINYF